MTEDISNDNLNPQHLLQELVAMNRALAEQAKETQVTIGVLRAAVLALAGTHHNPAQLSSTLDARAAELQAPLPPQRARQYAAAMQPLQEAAKNAQNNP